jgi:hypothetical protein
MARSETSLRPVQKELEDKGHTGKHGRIRFDYDSSLYASMDSAVSIPTDASNVASIKSAFATARQKLGGEPEVLLYNASGFEYG